MTQTNPLALLNEARGYTSRVEKFASGLPPGPLRRELAGVASPLRQDHAAISRRLEPGLGVPPLLIGAGVLALSGTAFGAWVMSHFNSSKAAVAFTECIERVQGENPGLTAAEAAEICSPPGFKVPAWAWGIGAGLLLLIVLASTRRR